MSKFGGNPPPEDEPRLSQQLGWVWEIMNDDQWHTILEIERTIQHKYNYTMQTSVSARIRDFRKPKFGGHTVEKINVGKGLWKYRLIRRTTMAVFNVAERIKQVREVEMRIEEMEKEFEAKVKPYEDLADRLRVVILQHLNETGQKSAATVYGTAYWKPKITYRVVDKDEFRRHVIGTEQWELITWAAAGNAAEEFTNAHGGEPPGLHRNAVNILYVNPPPKPRKKVIPNVGEPEPQLPLEDGDEPEALTS